MKNPKIEVACDNRILIVKYCENAVITMDDINEIYAFADAQIKGKKYCILFEAEGHFEVTEPVIDYLPDNPNNKNVLAKAYILNTREAEVKTRLHIVFDHPTLKPFTFKTLSEGKRFLEDVIKKDEA